MDLSLVLDDEMWKELCRRYDSVILITYRNLEKGFDSTSMSYHGGKALCVGLCRHMEDKLLSEMRGTMKSTEEKK